MEKIDIKQIIESKSPDFFNSRFKFFSKFILAIFDKFLHVKQINEVLFSNSQKYGIQFVDAVFEYLNFQFEISSKDMKNIPSEGKLVIVANHPLGGLDGLALIKVISEVRKDVKIVANDVLSKIKNIEELILPLDVYSIGAQKDQIKNIEKAILDEKAVIIFPSGIVSRLYFNGIHDSHWQNGAVKFCSKFESPVLPVFIDAKNSILFYLMSMINSKIGMFMLPRELFGKRNSFIKLKIGEVIPASAFKNSFLIPKIQSKLLKQHTYKIGKNNKGIFNTEKTIIHPIDSRQLKQELYKNRVLVNTFDGKIIYLVDYTSAPNVLKEISRLRELTFRKVGEGTGKTYDMDIYDIYYNHIVMWDNDNLEIVGSYRLGLTSDIIEKYGKKGLYNSSQFTLNDNFDDILNQSIEVGRSFIQQKYWRSNALDYIWQGIGAYLGDKPEIKYLWGAVSISDTYSELCKGLLISYYRKWYNGDNSLATSKNEYLLSRNVKENVQQILNSKDYIEDFKNLKTALKNNNYSIPVLYRRYTDLTEYGGTSFLSFCVDVNFNNSVDGLIVVDLSKLKVDFRNRYYGSKSFVGQTNDRIQKAKSI
jgi:putative hemolysin